LTAGERVVLVGRGVPALDLALRELGRHWPGLVADRDGTGDLLAFRDDALAARWRAPEAGAPPYRGLVHVLVAEGPAGLAVTILHGDDGRRLADAIAASIRAHDRAGATPEEPHRR
jgi:hypothetical protein